MPLKYIRMIKAKIQLIESKYTPNSKRPPNSQKHLSDINFAFV